ncbi:hypothetical protein DINM_021847 [Dirofilaria immitis]|nr:hypothetical protein [Dirofilaria immitis]
MNMKVIIVSLIIAILLWQIDAGRSKSRKKTIDRDSSEHTSSGFTKNDDDDDDEHKKDKEHGQEREYKTREKKDKKVVAAVRKIIKIRMKEMGRQSTMAPVLDALQFHHQIWKPNGMKMELPGNECLKNNIEYLEFHSLFKIMSVRTLHSSVEIATYKILLLLQCVLNPHASTVILYHLFSS